MAKKKGTKGRGVGKIRSGGRDLKPIKIPPKIPHALCPVCESEQQIQKASYIGAVNGMFWRCKNCDTRLAPGIKVNRR